MTTAHRATFAPAQGGFGKNEGDLSRLSKQYSARDLPSHTKLKYRQQGQSSSEDVKHRDFRAELTVHEKDGATVPAKRRLSGNDVAPLDKRSRQQDVLQQLDESREPVLQQRADSDAGDSDEDDDEEAELLAELARIKAEREAEKAVEDQRRLEEEEQIRTERILQGNPLLNPPKTDFKVQRRWDDDVVFKNCAKGLSDRKEPSFINDSIRSEFHRKFMEKYIK